jgi:hypothetical protein
VVNAGATRTIGVPVPASAIAYLQSYGPINLQVIADGMQTHESGYDDLKWGYLMVAAPG